MILTVNHLFDTFTTPDLSDRSPATVPEAEAVMCVVVSETFHLSSVFLVNDSRLSAVQFSVFFRVQQRIYNV